MKWMKLAALMLMVAFMITGCLPNSISTTDENIADSLTGANGTSAQTDAQDLIFRKYVDGLTYGLGNMSWEDATDAGADNLTGLYFYMGPWV